jgi:hypothetical protein
MTNPVAAFMKEEGLETLIYVHEIAKNDTSLTVDIHTWNPSNARQALEDLRDAVDELLQEWTTGKHFKLPPATDHDTKPRPAHYAVKWTLKRKCLDDPAEQPEDAM